MPRGFFITGTDTGVGKTIVAAALVKVAQALGFRAVGMKPIESGCRKQEVGNQPVKHHKESLIPADGKFLQNIADTDASLDHITPVRFENPLAPLPASEIEGTPVDMDKIANALMSLSRSYDVLIIEGVGGIMAPITENYFVYDLARDFGLPVIVVAKPGLGTINHTLLTVTCAKNEGLSVAGIIINYNHPAEGTVAEHTNPAVLAKTCPAPVIGIFPNLMNLTADTIQAAALRTLNLGIIKKYLS